MPFGRHQNNTYDNTTAGGPGMAGQGADYDYRTDDRVGPLGTGSGPSMNPAQPAPTHGLHNNMNAGQGAYGNHSNMNAGQGAYESGMTSLPPQHFNNQGGVAGGDPYANTVGNNDVAPVHHFSNGQRSGGASATTGKVERIIGSMVCSSSLKAKGMEKEQQAAAYKAQSAELSEAERLEAEASMRRQRAVDHGAHPANKALGGAAQAQEFGGNFGQIGAPGGGPISGNAAVPGARGGVL